MGIAGFTTTVGPKPAPPAAEVGVTVEGRRARTLVVGAVVVLLVVAAFFGGRIAARSLEADELVRPGGIDAAPSSQPPASAASAARAPSEPQAPAGGPVEELRVQLTDGESAAPGKALAVSSDGEPMETLRFLAFSEPTILIDAVTTSELNNSVGIDTTTLGDPRPVAVVTDLVVTGPAETTVVVHPGDRPTNAVRFTIPSSGRLLVPHLIAAADDAGRVVVSADSQVRVVATGIGTYGRADSSRAGRFVSTGSTRVGSLVTATDGRTLVVTLADVLGADVAHVGRAVVRLNANVGQAGGSVSIGQGEPISWPAPAGRDFGLAGTELLTVEPDERGDIVIEYLGGSVLTVDLVGYYTNDAAPESSSGLLVLSPKPELRVLGADGDAPVEISPSSTLPGGGGLAALALVTMEVSNGENGGSITLWSERDPVPTSAAFAVAPNQRRSTTEWLVPTEGSKTLVRLPGGASVLIWTLGAFT